MAQAWVFSHWFPGRTWTDSGAGVAAGTGSGNRTETAAGTVTEAGTGSGEETKTEEEVVEMRGRKDNLVVVEEKVVLVIVEVLVKMGEEGDESKEEDVEDGTGGEKY